MTNYFDPNINHYRQNDYVPFLGFSVDSNICVEFGTVKFWETLKIGLTPGNEYFVFAGRINPARSNTMVAMCPSPSPSYKKSYASTPLVTSAKKTIGQVSEQSVGNFISSAHIVPSFIKIRWPAGANTSMSLGFQLLE